jgi:hypothetical protein
MIITNNKVCQKEKTRLTKLVLVWILSVLMVGFTQAQTSEGNGKIAGNDKITSDLFKAKVGLPRLAEYKQLESLIIPKSNSTEKPAGNDYLIGQFAMSEADLILLLGNPDVKVSQIIYQYNLGGVNGTCKLYVGLDPEGFVSYAVIKACN